LTPEQFISKIEGYYARYTDLQRKIVSTYIGPLSDQALDFMFAETVKSFETRWGRPPDVATFEGLREAVRDRIEANPIPSDSLQIEDKSEYLPRDQVASIINGLAERLGKI